MRPTDTILIISQTSVITLSRIYNDKYCYIDILRKWRFSYLKYFKKYFISGQFHFIF